MKKILRVKNVPYENIEISDDEESEISHTPPTNGVYMYCIYDKSHKRWKPYKNCNFDNMLMDVSKIKQLEEKSSRI